MHSCMTYGPWRALGGGRQTSAAAVARRLTEIGRPVDAEVIDEETLGAWLLAPNEAFGGFKPLG